MAFNVAAFRDPIPLKSPQTKDTEGQTHRLKRGAGLCNMRSVLPHEATHKHGFHCARSRNLFTTSVHTSATLYMKKQKMNAESCQLGWTNRPQSLPSQIIRFRLSRLRQFLVSIMYVNNLTQVRFYTLNTQKLLYTRRK